ncbi:MAG: hypothetical protein WBG73_24000 [Coleofasciculaceae cyanobacterium]
MFSFFNPDVPMLCRKQAVFEMPDLPGLWRCHLQIGNFTVLSTFYTRLDQACIIWGAISLVIFGTAQFFPISWITQAVWWSVLSLIGTFVMIILTPSWLKDEGLAWILESWIILMILGLVITDLSIFLSWGSVLTYLCHLWLGLVGLGYILTGLGMRSRTLMIIGAVHLLGIALLPYFAAWQFLATGMIMGFSVFVLAEFQWDSFGTCGGN